MFDATMLVNVAVTTYIYVCINAVAIVKVILLLLYTCVNVTRMLLYVLVKNIAVIVYYDKCCSAAVACS